MKVAVFHNLPSGGAKRCVYEHTRRLVQRGYTVDAFTTSISDESFCPLSPVCRKVEIFDAPRTSSKLPVQLPNLLRKAVDFVSLYARVQRELDDWEALYTRIASAIDAGGYQLVYVHNCRLLQSPYLLRALRTRSVYFCQDSLRALHEWPLETHPDYAATSPGLGRVAWLGHVVPVSVFRVWQEKIRRDALNARAATRTLVNSHYSAEVMLREYGVVARVCNLGVDKEFYRPPLIPLTRQRVVVSVGGISPIKQYEFLVDAVATLSPAQRPPIQIYGYDLLGTPERESDYLIRLRARAEAAGVQLTVQRDGSDEAIREAYRTAGVIAFAPHLEPLGLIPLEAMACGAAVAGVAEGGVRETIADGETGLLTERDPKAFGAALLRLLEDPGLAARLGEAGRQSICRFWNWERSTDDLEAHFAHVTTGRSA